MKKIILLILVVALCTLSFAACQSKNNNNNQNNEPTPEPQVDEYAFLADITTMYKNSAPTKVVASTKQTIASVTLECGYDLVNGFVDNMAASVYTETKQELETVENGGSSAVILPLVKETTRVTEAIETIGSRVNGGNWDPQGSVSTIERGGMAIKLNKDNLKNIKYENNVLTFTIPNANVATVLGKNYTSNISSDVKVTIVNDGAVVTSIQLVYTLAANEEANLPESQMVVKVEYTYDLEEITIS